MQTKYCIQCKAYKELVAGFSKNKRKADGFDLYCKSCCRLRREAIKPFQGDANRQHRNAQARKRRNENPEKAKAYAAQWRKENPEKLSGYYAKWYAENRETVLAKDKARREANIEQYLERERASLAKRLDRKSETAKAWRAANPGKINRYASLRRASIANRTPRWLTAADFACMDLIYQCARVWSEETGIPHDVDHIYPLRGLYVCGLHVPDNLQILTASENRSKNNRWTPE